jgi:hypothetical protein
MIGAASLSEVQISSWNSLTPFRQGSNQAPHPSVLLCPSKMAGIS